MITKAALLLFRGEGKSKELMFVRSKKPFFVFPGGKQEEGESVEQALVREIKEELLCELKDVSSLGKVNGATPDGREIEMYLYTATLVGKPVPTSEIKEIEWLDKKTALARRSEMTPMTLDKVIPFLDSHKYW